MGKQGRGGWYYGWNIVIASVVLTLLTVGMRMGIGPFVLPMTTDIAMTRTDFSTIVAVGMFAYGVGMPIAGYMEKRFGTRQVLMIGASIVFISCIGTMLSKTFVGLLFTFGIFLSLGLAFTSPVAISPLIARWFVKRRGQALFYLATGSMGGIAIITPVNSMLINTFGWQLTMFIFAIAFILVVVPTALFIVREDVPEGADEGPNAVRGKVKSQDPHPQLTVQEAIKTLPFWQISIGLFACGYSMNLLGTHGVPMLIDHGFSDMTASFGIGLIGLVAIPSTVVLARLADQIPRKNILATIYLVRGLGFVFLVWAVAVYQLYLIALIAGVVWAGSIALSSALLADLYGVRLLGILYGWAYFGHQIGGTASSLLGGWGYDQFNTHWIAFGSAAIILIIASTVSYLIPSQLTLKKIKGKQKEVLA
ncbi:MFS transporter [Sporosarcina sp. HYO08]|uniref:MFS transporter n=1 Tax=Sporosarcina sp. HYO08 TaxID=1759557 RepID=UPI00079945DA|nr:MFS transporter [Sporosarcina sp. HYO08]KXH79314.1 MFS transporter [Sporosarcina sp. HYO08]